MHPAEKELTHALVATMATDRLLVVDDDKSHVEELRLMLCRHGFEILAAASESELWQNLKGRRPDLILLKLSLPGTDGIELCKRIQEHADWVDLPIVFFSASHSEDQVTLALESGAMDFLVQPLGKAELLSRIRTHLMLKTARDHLKRMAKDKEELLGMISHHLQSRLAGINMSAQLLVDRFPNESNSKLHNIAENIRASSCEMRLFIKGLLANAAADRGFSLNLESVRLSEAALRVLRQYEAVARAKEMALRSVVHEEGSHIEADAAALEQILDNLVSNAVKFSPPRTEVCLTLLRSGSHLECRIQDQGPGFTEEDKQRMFHRYARLSARPTGGEPSTGLGLSIARKLVLAMNGELHCHSSPGHGATFVLRFPILRRTA